MEDVGVKQAQRVAEEGVTVPGHDPHVQQGVLAVLHGVGHVKHQRIGEQGAQDREQRQRRRWLAPRRSRRAWSWCAALAGSRILPCHLRSLLC
jgi:hypothetical protein